MKLGTTPDSRSGIWLAARGLAKKRGNISPAYRQSESWACVFGATSASGNSNSGHEIVSIITATKTT